MHLNKGKATNRIVGRLELKGIEILSLLFKTIKDEVVRIIFDRTQWRGVIWLTEIRKSGFPVYYSAEKLQCTLRVRKGM